MTPPSRDGASRRSREERGLSPARARGRAVRPDLADHQDRARGRHAGLARRRARQRCRRSAPSSCWRRSAAALAGPRRLADRAVGRRACSSPASSRCPISACRACRPAARACSPTPTMLWIVPLSLLVGEQVGARGVAGVAARPAGHRRPGRSAALRLERPSHRRGPCLAAAGGPQLGDRGPAYAPSSLAPHAARRAALADERGDDPALDPGARRWSLPGISISARPSSGWRWSISASSPGRPRPGPPSRSPGRCRRSRRRSACWACRCSPSPRRSSCSASPSLCRWCSARRW